MVVNLTDPGGNRFVQLSITLKIDDAKTGDAIKLYMPTIRSGILLLVSQRSAEELLSIAGKEKLTRAIIREISGQLGYEVDDEDEDPPEDEPPAKKKKKKKRAAAPASPIQAVLYTSFIVQ
jgi:flagellar FliL protein